MATLLPDSAYAVLGLIDRTPEGSAHELARLVSRSLAHFWPLSRTMLYREVKRLEELGLTTSTEVRQDRLPAKRVYRLTEQGKLALRDWLASRAEPDVLRSGFLLRIYLGADKDEELPARMLADYRESLQAQLAELNGIAAQLERIPEAGAGRLAVGLGIRVVQAKLDWLADAEDVIAGD